MYMVELGPMWVWANDRHNHGIKLWICYKEEKAIPWDTLLKVHFTFLGTKYISIELEAS